MIYLWALNRWLKWLGFVVIVASDGRDPSDPERYPTRIGIVFTGWPHERGWARHCATVTPTYGQPRLAPGGES
jgi:hypothetical protein